VHCDPVDDLELNLATAWEAIASQCPEADALVHEADVVSWAGFEDRASRAASALADSGIGAGSKVGLHMYNCNEYLIATFAAFKLRAVPFNVNFRYIDAELRYLLENADAAAVISQAELAEPVVGMIGDLPELRTVITVGGDVGSRAVTFEELLEAPPLDPIPRCGEDLWFLYTGGTTGHPKAVMWPHSSLLGTMSTAYKRFHMDAPSSVDDVLAAARAVHDGHYGGPQRLLPAAPLMHGTSSLSSLHTLTEAGTVITMSGHHFDPDVLWSTVEAARVTNLTIVGDAFGRPMVESLVAATDAGRPFDLSSLRGVLSSGVMWSQEIKDKLLEFHEMTLVDTLGSSEGVGFGASVAKRGRTARTGGFRLGPDAAVFTEDGRAVAPGSGEVGVLAVGGPIPRGYYKDPTGTAATFREFEGRTWSVPGDHGTVEADGAITLLGRGSASINTAGEKVFPEEVEEAIKTHEGVVDCLVVGVADEKWGSAVTAVVSVSDPAVTEAALVAHAKGLLAGYKCPKHVVLVEVVSRGANGKPDYKWAESTAAAALGAV
jgi:acyl-CoA synthetase (AMP-forming)/AMP-acid ligase II